MRSETSPVIAVCLATYRRTNLLSRLLDSLRHLDAIPHVGLELRVVDNDKGASARSVVEDFSKKQDVFFKVSYAVEPRQNIAHARNRALEMEAADAFVFVDDDEWVEADWLKQLWETCLCSGADGVFGPVQGQCPEGAPSWMSRGGFFDKNVPATGTSIGWRDTRTSNTLVRGKWLKGEEAFRFDPQLGRSGGSDSELFSRLERADAHFVSCQEAGVSEEVPEERARLGWLWSRWYRNGLIFERIIKGERDPISPAMRAFRRFGASALLLLSGVFLALFGRKEQFVKGLLRFALALGGLKEWIRPGAVAEHVAYESKNDGEKESEKVASSKKRVAFLTNIVSPYRLPVFKHLAETPSWDFRVFVDAEKEFDRSWDVDAEALPIKRSWGFKWKRVVRSEEPVPFEQTITLHAPIGAFWNLLRFRPDAVISLELGIRTAMAALYCKLTRTPLTIWAYQSRVSGSQGQSRLWWRRFLLRQATEVVGMGKQAREVLRSWGVEDERIKDAPNASDHVGMERRLEDPEIEHQRAALKTNYAGDRKMAIVVGRLIPLKGIEHILKRWGELPASVRDEWQLVFVGDGPLEALVREAKDASVSLAGFVPSEDMALLYAAADLHIFPTCGDVWGLVVNEAGYCGTPSLCSVHAGCYDDMIEDGVDGLGIDFTAADAGLRLQRALEREDLAAIGEAARKRAACFTLSRLAQSFRAAVNDSLSPVKITGLSPCKNDRVHAG